MKIATRILKLKGLSGDIDVEVSVFAPVSDGIAWTCAYDINWPGQKWSSQADGVDSVQALVLALQKIAVEIYFSEYHSSGNLSWEGAGSGYGFPIPPAARDVSVGDDRKYY